MIAQVLSECSINLSEGARPDPLKNRMALEIAISHRAWLREYRTLSRIEHQWNSSRSMKSVNFTRRNKTSQWTTFPTNLPAINVFLRKRYESLFSWLLSRVKQNKSSMLNMSSSSRVAQPWKIWLHPLSLQRSRVKSRTSSQWSTSSFETLRKICYNKSSLHKNSKTWLLQSKTWMSSLTMNSWNNLNRKKLS